MRFKYQYTHLNCAYCLELSGGAPCCPHRLCPHILGNLEDLRGDPAFCASVGNADCCGTFHRPTLLHLHKGPPLCLE